MKKLMLFGAVLLCVHATLFSQYSVSGNVSDQDGNPLIGASIVVKETNKGTTSIGNGRYSITNLKSDSYNLVFSFLGYENVVKQIVINSDTKIDVVMSTKSFLADEVIVMATRANEKDPITTTNVSKVQYDKLNVGQDLPILLNMMPSVVTTSDAGGGVGYTSIRIRGTDASRTNVNINGIPFNDAESHSVYWVDIPDIAENVDHIQMQRGVGTSTNGAGAFGASLNLQTTGYRSKPYAEIKSAAGSFNTYKNTVGFGTGLINNHFTFDGRMSIISSDGYIDRASSNLKSYFTTAGYYSNKTIVKFVTFGGQEKTYQAWNGVPSVKLNNDSAGINKYLETMAYWGSVKGDSADKANIANANSNKYNLYRYKNQTDNYWQQHYQFLISHKLNNQLNFNAALHYTHGYGYYEEYKSNAYLSSYLLDNVIIGVDTITSTDLVRQLWLKNDFYGTTYSVNYKNNSTIIIFGGSANQYVGRHQGEVVWAQYMSNGFIAHSWYRSKGVKNDFSNYIKVSQIVTPQIQLFADIQYRKVEYNIAGTDKNLRDISQTHNYDFFNPKVGISLKIDDNNLIYSTLGISNREPTRTNFVDHRPGTPNPLHETLQNIEVGLKSTGNKYVGGVNCYYMNYNNQLVLTGELNEVGDVMLMNVKSSYRAGIEAQGKIIFSKYIDWEANTTFSQNKIKNFNSYIGAFNETGRILENTYITTNIAFSPSVVAANTFTFHPVNNAAVALQSKYVSKQFIDNTTSNDRKLNAYLVNNLILNYTIFLPCVKEITFNVLINNILNTKYITNGWIYRFMGETSVESIDGYFPQAGLNIIAGVSVKF